MSVVDSALAPVKAPVGWAKARPVVFIVFMLIVIVVVFRFRNTIAGWLSKVSSWPIVGRPIAFLAGMDKKTDAPPAAAT